MQQPTQLPQPPVEPATTAPEAAPQWLLNLDPNNVNLGSLLAEEADVLSINDLAVRIYLEENDKETPQIVPHNVRDAYKKVFGLQPAASLYGGNSLADLLRAFHTLTHGAQMLTSSTLSEGLVKLGQGISLREIKKVLEDIDRPQDESEAALAGSNKRDSKISFVEYCRFMRFKLGGRKPPSIKSALRKLFDHYDKDKNGSLNDKEVKKLLSSLGIKDIEAHKFIDEIDTNKDGVLSFDEIFKAIESEAKQSDDKDDNTSSKVWHSLKIWLQLSSGWDVAPKDPAERASLVENPGTKIVSFIRHGQSEGNLAADTVGSARGVFNPAITPKGVQQAQERGKTLSGKKFDLIVVSPMKRTLQTMTEVIGNGVNKGVTPIIGHPLIREQFSDSDDVGDIPKLIKDAWPHIDWSNFPDAPEVWWYPGDNYTDEMIAKETLAQQKEKQMIAEWEEPWEELMARASAFESWLGERPESNILCVTHGGFIEALVGPRMDNAQECILRVSAPIK